MNIKDLDEIIDFKKRKMMVLGGTYGIGKSTVALNIATNIAQQDVSVMIFKERLSKKIGDSNNIFICNIPRISIKKICEKTKKMKQEKNIKFVLIDDLQSVVYDGDEILGWGTQRTKICEILKDLSEELNISILLVSQVSVPNNRMENYRPILEDIDSSGKIEKEADTIMFLYREDYYNKVNKGVSSIINVIISKNVNGNTGIVELD